MDKKKEKENKEKEEDETSVTSGSRKGFGEALCNRGSPVVDIQKTLVLPGPDLDQNRTPPIAPVDVTPPQRNTRQGTRNRHLDDPPQVQQSPNDNQQGSGH